MCYRLPSLLYIAPYYNNGPYTVLHVLSGISSEVERRCLYLRLKIVLIGRETTCQAQVNHNTHIIYFILIYIGFPQYKL